MFLNNTRLKTWIFLKNCIYVLNDRNRFTGNKYQFAD